MGKLTDTQAWALHQLHDQLWRGTRESRVNPNTAAALLERGLVEQRHLGRRLEWRLTNAGVAQVEHDRQVAAVVESAAAEWQETHAQGGTNG